VGRTGTSVDFSGEEKPAGLLSEEARLQMSQMTMEDRTTADCERLDDPQVELVKEQPKKFLNEATMPPTSVDNDVKEEGGDLIVNVVVSKEQEMRRSVLDVVRVRPAIPGDYFVGRPASHQQDSSPPDNRTGGLFRITRKKRSECR
jgi:hypothetical protein